jgi:cell wall-associated NlpC family hydrolase
MRPEELPVEYVIKRREIVAAARDWVGVPYRHQGRTRNGIDCIGLLLNVAVDVGHPLTETGGPYSTQPQGYQLTVPGDKQLWKPARQDKLIPGDIGLFWVWSRREPQHIALFGETPHGVTIIHSFSKFQKVVEQSWNSLWAKRLHCIFNLPGTEEGYS